MQTSTSSPLPSEIDPSLTEHLDRLDHALSTLPLTHPAQRELATLRNALNEREGIMMEARQAIEKMEQIIQKLTAPANRIGTFIGIPGEDRIAQIVVGGADYYCNIDPRVTPASLRIGTRVLVNEAFAIVGDLGFDGNGPIAKVVEVLDHERLRVGTEHGVQSLVLRVGGSLCGQNIKAGDEVRVDANYRIAIELLSRPQSDDFYLEHVPELPWEKVGGQQEALGAIRDAVELPLLHANLFERFGHGTPKGFLLHGPPGCGKTLIGKATAWNLTQKLQERTGTTMRDYFMHIKGPEILNMWVGESERIVREIFAQAREKRNEGYLPFLFIDEAESILGTRRATRQSNILSTLVPMFCAEMDGIESLNDIVIILASNRADLIDPAILRPGRIDRKIKVNRPDRAGSQEIYRIYLNDRLPYDPQLVREAGSVEAAIDLLIDETLARQFAQDDASRVLEVTLRSGKREAVYRGDLVSGAMIASIVERAKGRAIKRAIGSREEEGLSREDLRIALEAEYHEGAIFPPAEITGDWLKLIDYDPGNVVRVSAIRSAGQEIVSAVI